MRTLQANLSLCWSLRSYCRICRALAKIILTEFYSLDMRPIQHTVFRDVERMMRLLLSRKIY